MPRPFVPIPLTCKVELTWFDSVSASQIVNVMHAQCSTSPTVAELTDIGEGFQDFAVAITNNVHPTGLTYTGVTVTDLNSATGPQVTVNTVAATGSGAHGATGVCALLKLTSILRGRSFRGRVYVGPLLESAVLGNVIAGGTASAIETAYDALEADLLTVSPASRVFIASRKLAGSVAATARQVETTPAYQRRRGHR